MRKYMALALAGLASASALAADWIELGDAGQSIAAANITIGANPLEHIRGSLSRPTEDFVDIYCIRIPDPSNFGATTVGNASFDTQLFLFDMNGMGVVFDDDANASVTQSTITGALVPAPGIYFLAISIYDRDARDASGNEIWADSPFVGQRAPDGPGAGNPLAGWTGGAQNDGGNYVIEMRGADFHVPEPMSGLVLALGALALRRR